MPVVRQPRPWDQHRFVTIAAIRTHADAAGLPVDEIIPIADTVIVRPDPANSSA